MIIQNITNNKKNILLFAVSNPGVEFKNTRHNAGAIILKEILRLLQTTNSNSQYQDPNSNPATKMPSAKISQNIYTAAEYNLNYYKFLHKNLSKDNAQHNRQNQQIIFLIAENLSYYMNQNGELLQKIYNQHQPDQIWIFSDNLELPMGKYLITQNNNPKGHNGLKNINKYFNNYQHIIHIKIGIGRCDSRYKSIVSDYVLSQFNQGEQEQLMKISRNILLEILQLLQ